MRISSFDIFDTCLVRKCGTPENFFDILSLRAFKQDPPEWARQEFVASRRIAQEQIESVSTTLRDIWDNFNWSHPLLKDVSELCQLEMEAEREMLVPVLTMRDKVNECRQHGDKIVFISDMYLTSEFLIDVMRQNGFYQEGDAIYVSCECGANKSSGELYKNVKEQEHVSYRKWHHYGDNKRSDYKIPKRLGIKATLVNHAYTPYQQIWADNDFSLGFKYSSILAGIGRAIRYRTEWNTHTDFVLDVVAPFYCSLVYRMMKDAEQRGITRLYFCARDAYMMYLIAEIFKEHFPNIENRFLYISKKSLYEGEEESKIAYFKQEGLITKTDNVGIVDFRSSGKTLYFLNEWLKKLGAKQVRGYYFEFIANLDYEYFSQDCYMEVNTPFIKSAPNLGRLLGYWNIYEQYFPLNTLRRTIGYSIDENRIAKPIFDAEEESKTDEMERVVITDKAYWAEEHTNLIKQYAQDYKGIVQYSSKIFENCAMPILTRFFETPAKEYLHPFVDFYAHYWQDGKPILLPYVKKCNPIELLLNKSLFKKRVAMWNRATLIYSIPNWAYPMIDKIIH